MATYGKRQVGVSRDALRRAQARRDETAPEIAKRATPKGILSFDKPAVIFEGGPWHGWSRFLEDTLAYAAMEAAEGFEFPYRQTRRTKTHPWTEGKITSEIWAWRPNLSEPHKLAPRWAKVLVPG